MNDLDRQMTFAYVMNKMGISPTGGLGTERTKAYTKPRSCAPTPSGQPRRKPIPRQVGRPFRSLEELPGQDRFGSEEEYQEFLADLYASRRAGG